MTITLTREEAQQVLGYLEEIHPGNMTPMAETNWNKAIEALRARLSAPEPEPVAKFVLADGLNKRVKLLVDGLPIGTLFYTAPPQPEPPCKTGSQCIGGKCPQCVVSEPRPAGWIYEDDEGRMMFSQMPTSALFWEPVYRGKREKNT